MIVFSNSITPRLQYILDFIGKETIGKPFQITDDAEIFAEFNGPKINYSREPIADGEFQIHDTNLLMERGANEKPVHCFATANYKAFFKTKGNFPFDIFAATFYLLSRYEEYLPHQKDLYGRYAHQNSLAYKEGFLHLPLINIWLEDFKRCLKTKFPELVTRESSFTFIPTYDIDEAYAYKHKQWWRTVGGIAKSMAGGQWSMLNDRLNVLLGKNKDPYDAFDWMNRLHGRYALNPIYFFLMTEKTGTYDKNILPSKKAMKDLILDISNRYTIGIHPSWQSGDDPDRLRSETAKLRQISGKQILNSRQHFIRFTLPNTYRRLIDLGVENDFSMGYGSINGFRASVASPFYWYDLEQEKQTKLKLYPFCFMEANSFFEQKFTPSQALKELQDYYSVVSSVNGTLITIWHNSFFGGNKLFEGWKEIYQQFISANKS